jgi:hypothetical protein
LTKGKPNRPCAPAKPSTDRQPRTSLARFLALTGLGPETIRAAAGSPGFLKAVLDHVAGHEDLLVGLADEMGTRPETIVEARRVLAGPGETD